MATKNRQIWRDQNILVNGIGNLGVSKSLKVPEIEFLTSEREGAIAVEEVIPLIKAMSAEIVLNEYNTEVYSAVSKQFSNSPTFFCKGSLVQGDQKIPVLHTIKGKVKKLGSPIPDRGKEVEMTLEISVSAFSKEINGVKVIDIDLENMICIIDGVDLFAELRAHIQ
jgi:P2 family phage contractile tail tube protein